jgi:uncharacterized protein YndB with AHSA1/START domain
MKIQRSIMIDAPAESVWALLVAPESIMKWCGVVQTLRCTSEQKCGVGTTFYFEERAGGRLMKLNLVVNEWIVNKSVAYKMISGNFVKGYDQRYALEPVSKSLQVTIFEDVTLPWGILGRLVGLLRKPRSNGHLDRMLTQLKNLSETKESGIS